MPVGASEAGAGGNSQPGIPGPSASQAPFISQLRELYQRSLRARELAQRTHAAASAAAMRGAGAPAPPAAADAEEPCPMTTDEDDDMDDGDRAVAAAAPLFRVFAPGATGRRAAAAFGAAPAPAAPPAAAAADPMALGRPGGGALRLRPLGGGGIDSVLFGERGWGAARRSMPPPGAAPGGGGGGGDGMEDDEDCPGLLDDDEETEEDEDDLPLEGLARDMLSWRRLRVAGGALGAMRRRAGAYPAAAAAAAAPGAAAAAEAQGPDPATLRPPQPCSFLRPGARFSGVQRLSAQPGVAARRQDDWTVDVIVEGFDPESGAVCGSMQALNVPGTGATPVVTWWEGHVVDDRAHTFYTRGAGAVPGREMDLKHWGKFEGFAQLRADVVRQGGRSGQLERHPWIYMRWKEQFFVGTGQDAGLTIAGFYYTALCRKTGKLRGFYYDPNSSPFQELELEPAANGRAPKRPAPQEGAAQQQQRQAPAPPAGGGGGFLFTSAWRHG